MEPTLKVGPTLLSADTARAGGPATAEPDRIIEQASYCCQDLFCTRAGGVNCTLGVPTPAIQVTNA